MMHEYIGKVVSISLMMFSLSVFGGELKLERYADVEYQFSFPSQIIFEVDRLGWGSIPALVTLNSGGVFNGNNYETIFTRCSGTATVNGNNSYRIGCVPNNGVPGGKWGIYAVGTNNFAPGSTVVWNVDIAGIIRGLNTAGLGITLDTINANRINGTYVGDPSMTLTSDSRVIKVPLKTGPAVSLPPNKGRAVVVLSYPSSITSNADKDGGYRTNLLKLTGVAGGGVSLETTISPQSGAKVIKNSGGDCSEMTVNDSCDIIFPAGAVPPGQTLKGSINITATMM